MINVTGLGLINLDFLPTLQCLNELIAAENKFECPKEIGECIGGLPALRKVEFRGCPAQKDIHYKEKIMAKAPRIGIRKPVLFALEFQYLMIHHYSRVGW